MDPVAVARAAFDDHLRSVIVYGVDEASTEVTADVRYVRDDLRASLDDVDDLARAFARDYHFESVERPYQEQLRPLGDLRASVRVFDRAVVVRSLVDDAGISVSVDPAGLSKLDSYIHRLDD